MWFFSTANARRKNDGLHLDGNLQHSHRLTFFAALQYFCGTAAY
jgi:hypothetical protein